VVTNPFAIALLNMLGVRFTLTPLKAAMRLFVIAVLSAAGIPSANCATTTTSHSCVRKPVQNERHVFGSHKAG